MSSSFLLLTMQLKEVSLIHSEGVLAGELKHGPLALIDNDLPVIIIATADTSLNKMHTVVEQLRSRNANLIVICHKTDRIIQGFRGPDCFLIEVTPAQPYHEANLVLQNVARCMLFLLDHDFSDLALTSF